MKSLFKYVITALVAFAICHSQSHQSLAQGLVWSLPEDTSYVRYEGEYKETIFRPENVNGDLSLSWRRSLTIRSVGKLTADYKGEQLPCRWLEFEMSTGREVAGRIAAGPGGYGIIKVLVPEKFITGKSRDQNNIPVEYIPIVKGYRKIDDNPVETLNGGILQLYPMFSLLRNYTDVKDAGQENLELNQINYTCTKNTAKLSFESPVSRSTHEATMWQSADAKFGLAKWQVKIEREKKDGTAARGDFRPESEITVKMEAVEQGDGDQSRIAEQ